MRVDACISGSHCVVFNHKEHYIDARKDVRKPHLTYIEIVRSGHVYLRDVVDNEFAPNRILTYMKQEFLK